MFDIYMEIAKREQLKSLKKEYRKAKAMVSSWSASNDVQKNIEVLKEKDLTKMLKEHINSCLKAEEKPSISIKGAWKVTKHVVKI